MLTDDNTFFLLINALLSLYQGCFLINSINIKHWLKLVDVVEVIYWLIFISIIIIQLIIYNNYNCNILIHLTLQLRVAGYQYTCSRNLRTGQSPFSDQIPTCPLTSRTTSMIGVRWPPEHSRVCDQFNTPLLV